MHAKYSEVAVLQIRVPPQRKGPFCLQVVLRVTVFFRRLRRNIKISRKITKEHVRSWSPDFNLLPTLFFNFAFIYFHSHVLRQTCLYCLHFSVLVIFAISDLSLNLLSGVECAVSITKIHESVSVHVRSCMSASSKPTACQLNVLGISHRYSHRFCCRWQ